jgi:hypothetical protein
MTQIKPNTVEEALAAWDRGDEVETIEMGGLGEGYEMAIQCVAFELMRALTTDPDLIRINASTADNQRFPEEFGKKLDSIISGLDAKDPETGHYKLGGLSGAQVGAAKSMAVNLVRHGYANAREKVPERLIFVRKQDPVKLYEAHAPQS